MRRETLKIAFTKRRLEALESPESGRVYVHDTGCPGLALCITESGTKTFYFYRWAQGQPQRKKLGRFPEVTIEQARDQAKKMAGKFADGKDPIEEARAAKRQATLGDAWQHFKEYKRTRKRASSRVADERYWTNFLEPWKGRRLAKITRTEVQALHSRVGSKNGIYRANRLLALLSSIYTQARDIGFEGGNPCSGVERFAENERDRYLLPHEVRPFLEALSTEPNETIRDMFAVCLFTGQRSGNVKSMKWADVSLEGGFWRIPPEEAKAGETILVPLTPAVAGLLERRQEEAKERQKAAEQSETSGDNPWVFPGRPGGKKGHITEIQAAWKRICKRAGLEGLRIHDLRRSCGSWQAALGTSLHVIGKSLGHRNQATTAIYSKLDLGPVRNSLEAAEAAILLKAMRTPDLLPMPEPDQPADEEGNDDAER